MADKVTVPHVSEVRGTPLLVSFAVEQPTDVAIERLSTILAADPGNVPVQVELTGNGVAPRRFAVGDRLRVDRRLGLYDELKSAFGPHALREPGHAEYEAPPRQERAWANNGA